MPSGGKKAWAQLPQPPIANGRIFVGYVPSWGAQYPLNEPRIVDDIAALKAMGGDVTIAFGGAVGPYLEHARRPVDRRLTG